jgi:NADH dehydrogenase
VGDHATAIANVADGTGTPGTVYELGGPDVLSFRELLERTLTYTGRKRGFLSMPFWLAKLQALLTWPLPNSLRPLTVDQVRLLQSNNVVSVEASKAGRTLEALGVPEPQTIGSIVPGYLERFKPKGQYSHYQG